MSSRTRVTANLSIERTNNGKPCLPFMSNVEPHKGASK